VVATKEGVKMKHRCAVDIDHCVSPAAAKSIDYISANFPECDRNWMSSRIPSRFSAQLSTTEFSQLKSGQQLRIE